jgi:hypothetical protein
VLSFQDVDVTSTGCGGTPPDDAPELIDSSSPSRRDLNQTLHKAMQERISSMIEANSESEEKKVLLDALTKFAGLSVEDWLSNIKSMKSLECMFCNRSVPQSNIKGWL